MAETAIVTPFVDHPSPRALAHALYEYAKGDLGTKLALRPFNRFQPDDTFWWICPDTDDPAFRYGKYVIKSVADLEPATLFAGIAFEKGIGPTGKDFFPKSWLTVKTWTWNEFFEALSTGGFDRFAQAAQDAAGLPVTVIVSPGLSEPPTGKADEDAYRPTNKRTDQQLYFQFDSGRLTFLKGVSTKSTLITDVTTITSLRELAAAVQAIKSLDWVWVSVELGFLLANKGPCEPKWYTEDDWAKACEPFVCWFR